MRDSASVSTAASRPSRSFRETFWVALKLGLTSFGGPIAHLGYFERTYVRERCWLNSEQYGVLVSLCQLLPCPTSSQVGFLVGLHRGGWLGALCAWAGFTLPSALLMYAFALFAPAAPGFLMQAVMHGLMLTAVVVVAQAVWRMARTLTPDLARRLIALTACAVLLIQHSAIMQLATLTGGALAGSLLCRSPSDSALRPSATNARRGWLAFALFGALLISLSGTAFFVDRGPIALASIFYRSGALVFGGGHVVLPLLQQALVPTGWLSDDRFLAGYGFAQAMPGPLFSLAAYLGAATAPPHQSLFWALLALVAIFLPGLLLALTGLSAFGRIARRPVATSALAGVNAAVVGLLAAALYYPVWVSAVHSWTDVGIVGAAFLMLQRLRAPPVLIAALCALTSIASAKIGQ